MAASLLPWIKPQFTDAEGVPTASGQLYSFVAGTDTPQPTYSDSDLTIANANPILLNAGGWSNTSIYLLPTGYKFRLDTVDDVPLWTVDHVLGAGAGGSGATGDWGDIAYNAGNFTAPGGSWAITQTLNRWRAIGDNLVVWQFEANPSTVTGAPTHLQISNLPWTITQTHVHTRVVGINLSTAVLGNRLHMQRHVSTVTAVMLVKEDGTWFTGAERVGFTVVLEVTPT